MAETQLHLLKSRRLLPLFVTQFLGAVNDNLLKVALVTLITFQPITDPDTTRIVVAIATAIFILPYFLFSATAGQIADLAAGLTPGAVLGRLGHLGRDFDLEVAEGRDGPAYRLGGFKAFLGQREHGRHRRFAAGRATIS